MSKICTDLEQGLKLVELGLSPSTADMYFEPSVGFRTEPSEIKVGDIKNAHPRSVPAWSLSALIELMPKSLKVDILPVYDLTIDYYDGFSYVRGESALEPESICNAESFIDNAYKMVCWLLENGYIK